MTNKSLITLAGCLFLTTTLANSLFAQVEDHPWAASVSVLTHQYKGDFGDEIFQFQSDSDFGFTIGISRYLNDRMSVRFDFVNANIDYNIDRTRDFVSRIPPSGPEYFETQMNFMRLGLNYIAFEIEKPQIKAYGTAGFGLALTTQSADYSAAGSETSVNQIPIHFGIGFDKKLSSALSWNLEFNYHLLTGNEKDNIEGKPTSNGVDGQFGQLASDRFLTISTGLKLGIATKKDTDGDGIADKEDACPNVPGLKDFNGCPDADRDGVIDSEDACPNVAGLKSSNGCPDTDGDGIADKEDACPNVPGLKDFNGCPDADRDGVIDSEDACPNVAGLKSLNGCPDTDGDGIIDANDNCPNVAGISSFVGCNEITYYLDFDSSEISLNFTLQLDKLIKVLKVEEEKTLVIEGHTDNVGTEAYNQALSQRRAQRAYDYIIKAGIDASRIELQLFGETKPLRTADTEEARAKNRRVVIRINI